MFMLKIFSLNFLFDIIYSFFSEKYKLPAQDAKEISEFLLPMLYFNAQKRSNAVKCLQQPWIANVDVNNFESIF